jgi:protein-disulfide isomerase
MKRLAPSLIVVVVLLLAATGAVLFFRAHQKPPAARSTSKIGTLGAQPPHVLGSDSASVTLEEFGDFECPPCAGIAPVLGKLREDYKDRLRLVFRQYPMAVHAHAMQAAAASEAAGLQNKFWQMHARLYLGRSDWAAATDAQKIFEQYAREIGLDVARFQKDLTSDAVKQRIAADQERAKSLHVERTPTIYVNDELVPPHSFSFDGLRAAIEAALKQKPR